MRRKGHKWEPHPESMSRKRPFQSWRVCIRCGKEQMKHTNYEWGRVRGYVWRPLAGRCKP